MLCAIKQKDRRWVGINLLGMAREVLSELVTFYLRSEGGNHVHISGKSIYDQRSNKYKGPEARLCTDCSRKSNKVSD